MENKYYTPSIEDLHVGMECEILVATTKSYGLVKLDELGDRDPVAEYEDWQVTRLTPGYINAMHYRVTADGSEDFSVPENVIRVKYLNKEDIESLKFVSNRPYDGEFRGGLMRVDGRDYTLRLHFNDSSQWVKLDVDANYGEEVFFQGIVKNKTELKVILKQIGYER